MSVPRVAGTIELQERRDLNGAYIVRKAIRCLGLKPGDVVSVELGQEEPVVVHRALDCDLFTLSEAVFTGNAIVRADGDEPAIVSRAQRDEPESGRGRLKLVRGGDAALPRRGRVGWKPRHAPKTQQGESHGTT